MYVTNGSAYGTAYANAPFVGSLMCALTYSSNYQTKLNSFYSTLLNKADENYFNDAMRILTALLVSGNMPNLAATAITSSSSVASSSSVQSSSSVASSSSVQSSSSVASSSSVQSSSSVASSSSVQSSSSIESSSSVQSSSSVEPAAGTEWTSTIAALSNITTTGVHIGSSTDWTSERIITKVVGPVTSGTFYTLSFDAFVACGGADMTLTTTLGSDVDGTDNLTVCATTTVSYTFTATETGTLTLTLTMPGERWEGVDISNLKLISSSGEDVTVPGQDKISNKTVYASVISMQAIRNTLFVEFPKADAARVDIFDLRGKHLATLLSGNANRNSAISLEAFNEGLYIIRAKQGPSTGILKAKIVK